MTSSRRVSEEPPVPQPGLSYPSPHPHMLYANAPRRTTTPVLPFTEIASPLVGNSLALGLWRGGRAPLLSSSPWLGSGTLVQLLLCLKMAPGRQCFAKNIGRGRENSPHLRLHPNGDLLCFSCCLPIAGHSHPSSLPRAPCAPCLDLLGIWE